MKTNLTIIIPTLSNIKGLNYLLNYFYDKPYKIAVIDNKKKNLGFAGGVNKGAKNIKTKWLLILNDDIEFYDEVSINQLIEFAEKNKMDAVSPILINPNGEVENYGYKVLPYGSVKLVKSVESVKSVNIDGLTAACLLVKTKVFKKLNGFDESFFAYLEDVDFFLRLKALDSRLRGNDNPSFSIAYDIEVIHNHMTTTKTMGNFKARQDMINWWRLYFKHQEKFQFNFKFILERLKNISGFIKATFSTVIFLNCFLN